MQPARINKTFSYFICAPAGGATQPVALLLGLLRPSAGHIEPSQWRHQTLLSPSFLALIYAQNSKVLNDVLGGEDTFFPLKTTRKIRWNKENCIGWPDSRRRPQVSHRWFPISTVRPANALGQFCCSNFSSATAPGNTPRVGVNRRPLQRSEAPFL